MNNHDYLLALIAGLLRMELVWRDGLARELAELMMMEAGR